MKPGRGHIDRVGPDGDRTVISGFYQFLDFGRATDFDVFVGAERVEGVAVQAEMPSPDIAEGPLTAELPGADRCRFSIAIDVPYDQVGEHTIVRVRPRCAHGHGISLVNIHRPRTTRPDEEAILSIGGGYEPVAAEFLAFMIDLGGLEPTDTILEIGSGIGRMALGPSAYLTGGSYVGLDVAADSVHLARSTFEGEAAIRFQHLDLYNGWYNPNGQLRTTDVRLADEVSDRPDLIVMTSVLTHLFPADAEHYLRECRSVLADGGAVLATAWLVNAKTRRDILAKRSAIPFHEVDGYWIQSADNPEGAIAQDEDFLLGAIERAGLRVERLDRGYWADQRFGLTFQDLLILRAS